jgi:acyl-CoA synthetase (AMP-forming)/AMP-acid ligase II
VLTTGGEPLHENLAEALGTAFPNARRLVVYGMTEAGPRISHETFEAGCGTDGCVGRPYPHFEWRIEPIEEELAQTGAGRFVLRGPSMFLGYIAADGTYQGLDDDGFFHSHDLLSVDSTGRLHFRGRLDRIFKSGGKMVNPEAVERVILMDPAVDQACCFAAPHPILGLVPVAEIVATGGVTVDLANLLRRVSAHVEPHAIPRRIHCVSRLELADSGKQRRPAHRAQTARFPGPA